MKNEVNILKRKIISISICLLLLLIVFSGCSSSSEDEDLLGCWSYVSDNGEKFVYLSLDKEKNFYIALQGTESGTDDTSWLVLDGTYTKAKNLITATGKYTSLKDGESNNETIKFHYSFKNDELIWGFSDNEVPLKRTDTLPSLDFLSTPTTASNPEPTTNIPSSSESAEINNQKPHKDKIESFNSTIAAVKSSAMLSDILLSVEPFEGDYTYLICTISDDCTSLSKTKKQEIADEIGKRVQAAAISSYYESDSVDDWPYIEIRYQTNGVMATSAITNVRQMKLK